MIPVETIPGIVGGRIKENGGGGEFKNDYLIHGKNICISHNVSLPSTTIKKRRKRLAWEKVQDPIQTK
jgi:hypothetical protein